jgi:hypothetical protein
MHRATPIATLALAAAATAAGPAIVADASAAPAKRQVLNFYATPLQFKLLDIADIGMFSLGDEAVFSDNLLTGPGGKRVGFDGGVCTVIIVDDATAGSGTLHCVITTSLKGGTITTQGFNKVKNLAPSGTELSAITGGTGRYQAARGQLRVTFLPAGKANIKLTITS